MNFVIPDLIRLSEDEPYGVKGANIIFKFSKLQEKHDGHQSPSKFSKLRRSSNISSCSTSSEHDGFEGAVTIGDFKICNDTVSNKCTCFLGIRYPTTITVRKRRQILKVISYLF